MVTNSKVGSLADSAPSIDRETIEQNVDRLRDIADQKGIDLGDQSLVPYSDMNGPIVRKDSVDFETWPGVSPSFEILNDESDVPVAMLSGWDVGTLEYVAGQRLGIPQMDVVGELGAVSTIGGQNHDVTDLDKEPLEDFRRSLWELGAEHEIVLHEQGNQSSVVGCIYGEGSRKGLLSHPVAERSVEQYSPRDLYDSLVENSGSAEHIELDENTGEITLNPYDVGTRNALSETWREGYPLLGFQMDNDGDWLILEEATDAQTEGQSDDEFLKRFQGLVDEAAEDTEIKTEHNPDNSTDYVNSKFKGSKTRGATYRAERLADSFYLTNIGDKSGDVLEHPQAINFVQEGMPAVDYVEDNNILHIRANDATEYALTLAELASRN